MRKITLLSVLAMLCLNFNSIAQEPVNNATANTKQVVFNSLPLGDSLSRAQFGSKGVAPLRVGDKLPQTFWQQEHTIYSAGQTTTQTLEQYKGKLLILDFWATWCGSCIAKFPLLNNLQQAYAEKTNILLVNKLKTDPNAAKVKQVFDRHTNGLHLSTILGDTYLGQLFPHWQLPHYVWIGKNGTIIGFTGTDFVNGATIAKIIDTQHGKEARP